MTEVLCRLRRVVLTLGIVLGASLSAAGEDTHRDDLMTIAKTIRAQLSQVRDLSFTFTYHQTGTESPEYLSNEIKMREIFRDSGDMKAAEANKEIADLKAQLSNPPRYDYDDKDDLRIRSDGLYWVKYSNGSIVGWDGKNIRNYDPTRMWGFVGGGPSTPDWRASLMTSVHDMRLDNFLEEAAKKGKVLHYEEQKGQDGQPTLVVKVSVPPDPACGFHTYRHWGRWATLWLQPRKGFMPCRIDTAIVWNDNGDNPPVSTTMQLESSELMKGVWYPIAAKYTTFNLSNLADPGKPVDQWPVVAFPSNVVVEVRLENLKVNQGLKESDFQIDFPPGTRVHEKLAETRLPLGIGHKVLDIERSRPLVSRMPGSLEPVGPAGIGWRIDDATEQDMARGNIRKWLAPALVMLFGAGSVAALVAVRRARKRHRAEIGPQH